MEILCNACEEEVSCLKQHLLDNKTCFTWNRLLNESPTSNIATVIQQTYMTQISEQLKCDNCNIKYSNVGNLNKHYKKHLECLKMNLYNNVVSANKDTKTSEISDQRYYEYWPTSLYNDDLQNAANFIISYLKELPLMSSQLKKAIIVDCDETLFFGDPRIIGMKELELGYNRHGNQIFILPVNREIAYIMSEAKKIGLVVIVVSSRPTHSYDATKQNLAMFNIDYDIFDATNDKAKIDKFIEISKSYDIVCTMGDSEEDCFLECPLAVKLPEPGDKRVKIYQNKNLTVLNAKNPKTTYSKSVVINL